MRHNCNICGRFTKESNLVSLSDDYEEWLECKKCISPYDFKVYFSREILSETERAFVRLYERVSKEQIDNSQNEIYKELMNKIKVAQEEL